MALHWPTANAPCHSPNPAGKLTAAEYLTDLEGDSPSTVAAVAAFTPPAPLNWAAFTDVELAALVLADKNGDKALDPQEFFEYLNPEGGSGGWLAGWLAGWAAGWVETGRVGCAQRRSSST